MNKGIGKLILSFLLLFYVIATIACSQGGDANFGINGTPDNESCQSCSNEEETVSEEENAAPQDSCKDGVFCDEEDAPDNINTDDVSASLVAGPTGDENLQVGTNVSIEIAPNSFSEDTEITAVNGVALDNLGTDSHGVSNKINLGNSIEMLNCFDIVEVFFDSEKLLGSLRVCFDYKSAMIDTFNEELSKAYPGIFKLRECDFGIYFFDKEKGEFIPCKYELDDAAQKFILNTQIPGIYVLALKHEVFLKFYQFFEDNPHLVEDIVKDGDFNKGKQIEKNRLVTKKAKSDGSDGLEFESKCSFKKKKKNGGLKPADYAHEPPRDVKEWGDWWDTNCSAPGILSEFLYQLFGDKPFFNHDNCYRYGLVTYGYSRKKCDNVLLTDMLLATDERYAPFKGPKGWEIKLFWGKTWIPNPLYLAWRATTFPLRVSLYGFAHAAYAGVRIADKAKEAYHEENTSGCYDYAKRGVKCDIARINKIEVKPKKVYQPGETATFEAEIFGNQDEGGILAERMGLSDRYIDKIEWNLSPASTGLDLWWSDISPKNSWTLPPDISPGEYTLTASLFDNLGWIYSKSVPLYVGTDQENIALNKSMVTGEGLPDYVNSVKKDSSGNLYTATLYTGRKKVQVGTKRECHIEWCWKAWEWFRCKKCKTVPVYDYFPVRNGYIRKYNSSMAEMWKLKFPKFQVKDLALNDDGIVALVENEAIYRVNSNGTVAGSFSINTAGWNTKKIFLDSLNNIYVLYTKPSSGFTIKKFNFSGSMKGQISGITGGYVSDFVLKGNSIYVLGKKGNSLRVAKSDLNLALQWEYSEDITGYVISGHIDADSAGNVYFTGEGRASAIFGEGHNGSAYFISALDLFGNKLWQKGLNGATPSVMPSLNKFYLPSTKVLPLVKVGLDGKIYLVSGLGISIRRLNENGDMEEIRSLFFDEGNPFYRGMLIGDSGEIGIYGSTDGIITGESSNSGELDWFYLETESL